MTTTEKKQREALVERLRSTIQDIRRKPYPISDLIPLLTQAADALALPPTTSGEFNGGWILREVKFNERGAIVDWRLPPTVQMPSLNDGEIYIGLIGNASGEAYHLVLLPGDNDDATWQAQMDWAKSIGGDLPNRIEQAMLWVGHRDKFQKDWYWSNESRHNNSSWSWCQTFRNGDQVTSHEGSELRARAVRRIHT